MIKKNLWMMAICLLLFSCRTKKATTHQEEQKTEFAERLIQQEENTQKSSVSSEQIQTEIKELQELISNINVSFDGKELDDKLDILLKKTNEGTKLTFQGKGNVNYSESIKSEIESLKNEVLKRQDSVFTTLNIKLSDFELKLDHYLKTKDKEVKVKGFTFEIWIYIIVGSILLIISGVGFMRLKPKLF
ncbi:hypothetical protein CAPN004_10560 [Capnocytophaga cynodegmi]|uniref:hypothetical protein n=1 Tax=Capnocytophaga cynodegmi TaxID=28189 RepID=UPI001AD2F7E1|nr:hypothetical protein [Capnocytophaga cynodegmi]GIM52026.1 hypothetical protein CAPN004_10560 [Capnocytophaga cynodegmi]